MHPSPTPAHTHNGSSPHVTVQQLRKVYQVPVRQAGAGAALKSLFRRENRDVVAVDSISFSIQPGEVVGFLGPNGAGKTTTLKMLSGLLYPSGGMLRVLGYDPWQRENDYLRQIALVMGNRNQLEWDIPCSDSYLLHKVIYKIPDAQFQTTLRELTELLELEPLLNKPVRNLSLGERMKVEIAGSLLHRPRVLFLDEPTLGLDVTMQRRIREFVREYNHRHGATVMLTSHYMADVEALCRRVIVIHHGRLLFDGELSKLITRFSAHKTIVLEIDPDAGQPEQILLNLAHEGEASYVDGRYRLRAPKELSTQITARLLTTLPVLDLTIEEPPIEEVIEQVFALAVDDIVRDNGKLNGEAA